jgi:uncharacterized protein (DUF1499 family)
MAGKLSPWIRWPGYLAWVFLALLPIAVLTVRGGSWQQGLLLYALACLLSVLLLGVLGVLAVLPRFSEHRRDILLRALPALPGALLLITALQSGDVPPIHDISTDTEDPPRFEKIVALRGADSNPLDIDPQVIAQQEAAYPDLATLQSPRNYGDSFRLALETARALGWEVVNEDVNAGLIEAVDTTAIMGFKDDVVIRLRTGDSGVIVDLRSVSRVGVSDLGANAARIRAFLERFRETVAV